MLFQIVCNKTSIRNSLPYENNFHKTSIKQIPKYVYLYPKPWGKWQWLSWMSFWVSWIPGPSIKVKEMLLAEVAQEGQSPLVSFGWLFAFQKNTTWDRQIFFYQSWWNADWNAVGSYFKAHFEQKHFSLFFRKLMQDVNGLIFLGQEPLASQQVPCSFLTGSLFVSYRFQLEHTLCQRLCEWHVIV